MSLYYHHPFISVSYTVPKKEATEFTKEAGAKATLGTLKAAVDKAMEYLNTDALPPHWDRDLLFGVDISEQDSDGTESDVSAVSSKFLIIFLSIKRVSSVCLSYYPKIVKKKYIA